MSVEAKTIQRMLDAGCYICAPNLKFGLLMDELTSPEEVMDYIKQREELHGNAGTHHTLPGRVG